MAPSFRLPRLRKRTLIFLAVGAVFTTGCFIAMSRLTLNEEKNKSEYVHIINIDRSGNSANQAAIEERKTEFEDAVVTTVPQKEEDKTANPTKIVDINEAIAAIEKDSKTMTSKQDDAIITVQVPPRPNYNVHIFYYAWYGNPKTDDKYMHWNHEYLHHWVLEIDKRHRHGVHKPPDDIGSNFYPALGPYSSKDPQVIHDHMKQMCLAGVGVVALSWYPPGQADDQGGVSDNVVPLILEIAHMYDMKVTLHVEPYKDRNDKTLHKDVKYIIDKYYNHKAFYKYKHKDGRLLPLLYIYDSYRTKSTDWANLLKPDGSHTVRNTPYDCVFISLMVEASHRDAIEVGGFDGFYTYFATDGFTYGSSWKTWGRLAKLAKQTNTMFIPSVGPGYIDTSVRPWNSQNTRSRQNGEYYRRSWNSALSVNPEIVSITSFNEWHEGTQIEKAVPKSVPGLVYHSYEPHGPDYYLKITNEFARKMAKS